MNTAPTYRRTRPQSERAAFLAGLADLESPYTAGDLANLVGIGAKDVLDLTAHLASKWEHPDMSIAFLDYWSVERWLRSDAHGNHAAEVEIVIKGDGVGEKLAEVFYGEVCK